MQKRLFLNPRLPVEPQTSHSILCSLFHHSCCLGLSSHLKPSQSAALRTCTHRKKEPQIGFEPTTFCLLSKCSTTKLLRLPTY